MDFGNASLSQTDASNNFATRPGIAGGDNPNQIDDSIRALIGMVFREWNWRSPTVTAAGTATAYTLTYTVAPAAYYNGQRFTFIVGTTNTGALTVNVNSLGAKAVRMTAASGTATALAGAEMLAGAYVELAYNTSGDYFLWLNPPSQVLLGTLTTTSGTTHSLTDISPLYRRLYCEIEGVSLNNTFALAFTVSADNGSNYGTAVTISSSLAAAPDTFGGSVMISNLQTTGIGCSAAPAIITSAGVAFSTVTNPKGNAGASGPYNAIRFTGSGATFDAGSIRVYGLL